ncbi:MAG: response regulator [Candidatus Thiodiazotropha sp.]
MAEQALHPYSQHPGDKPLVLIADDSRVVRVSLRNILKDHCDLIEVEDGQQAWNELSQNPAIDLVFSDLSMPNLDGRGLLAKMRQSETEHLSRLPFVVVTGNEATPEIAREMQQLGASGMVSKPFDAELITSYLNHSADQLPEETASDWQDSSPQTDFLDHIPDRSKFMEIASRELSFAIRNKNELALALLRIDQFDGILDHYSDGAIEHILLAIHDIVEQHIHPDDTLAYLGSGRFAILRPASNAIGTRYLGRRILEDIAAKSFYLGESDRNVSASIGISAPDIKPGFRLSDLMSLAEGRLKAALESGGGKVVDKGNENLTPVSITPDLSEISTAPPTEHKHPSSHLSTEIQRLAVEQVAEIKAKYSPSQESVETQLLQYQQTVESLTAENRQLLEDVEQWKKHSAEADNLRRQLFEIESERQQVKLKFNELQDNYQLLDQRCTFLTQENRRLIEEEDHRTSSLRQAHGFTEEENKRLEDHAKDLRNRAEKAELESLKLNQLVSSLRENGQLLRMQLDQAQQEIDELKAARQSAPPPVTEDPKPTQSARATKPQSSDSILLNEIYESELSLTATPNLKAISGQPSQQAPATPVNEAVQAKPAVANAEEKPTKQSSSQNPPPFRIEKEPFLFKNGINPSAFTIASVILTLLLLAAGLSVYFYLKDSPVPAPQATTSVAEPKATAPTTASPSTPQALVQSQTEPHQVQPTATRNPPIQNPRLESVEPSRFATATPPVARTEIAFPVSEESRLEKELTLRQMAEEEFQRRLNRSQSSASDDINNAGLPWNVPTETSDAENNGVGSTQTAQDMSEEIQPGSAETHQPSDLLILPEEPAPVIPR